MKDEKLLEIMAESCKETKDCKQCPFELICPLRLLRGSNEMMCEDRIGIMLDEGAKMPTRAHDADAGYDLYAKDNTVYHEVIMPGASAVFDTGVHIAIPRGYVGFLKSKSGLNVKHGIVSEGVVDSGYTGSIRIKLYNHGIEPYAVQPGDKISQLVILPIITPELEIVDRFDETERGENGFGSSGR